MDINRLETAAERVREAQKELKEAQSELMWYEKNPNCHMADIIHATMCRFNHTDQCGYEYESWSSAETVGVC